MANLTITQSSDNPRLWVLLLDGQMVTDGTLDEVSHKLAMLRAITVLAGGTK